MTIDRAIAIIDPYSTTTEFSDDAPTDEESLEAMHIAAMALRFLKAMKSAPTCNNCGKGNGCEYLPEWGKSVRYNCPHYVKEMV